MNMDMMQNQMMQANYLQSVSYMQQPVMNMNMQGQAPCPSPFQPFAPLADLTKKIAVPTNNANSVPSIFEIHAAEVEADALFEKALPSLMSLMQKSSKPFMPLPVASIRPRENSQDCQTKNKLSTNAEGTNSDSSSTNRKLIDAIRMIQSTNKNNLY